MDEIKIENIKLRGKHGCFAAERNEYRDFEVSLRLFLPLDRAAKTDELSDTVDYPAAAAIAEGVLAGESVRLIEKLADRKSAWMSATTSGAYRRKSTGNAPDT